MKRTEVYLLKDEKTVELFNKQPYACKHQREMTVAEHTEALKLYKQAKEFAEEFVGKPWCTDIIKEIIKKVHNTPNTILFNGHKEVESLLKIGSEYLDIYFQGDLVDISVTFNSWCEFDPIEFNDFFDVEVKNQNLSYAYEGLREEDKTVIIKTKEELDAFYNITLCNSRRCVEL